MVNGDVDAELLRLSEDQAFPHRDEARRAIKFRAGGDVTDLVAIVDSPHPCSSTDVLFAMAGSTRKWLNWVPMPGEAICNVANDVGARLAQGEEVGPIRLALSAAEPASAIAASIRVMREVEIGISDFPDPDLRAPMRRGRHAIWRYDGELPVPTVPVPSPDAVRVLREVGGEPWTSPLSGYVQARPFAEVPLPDLLGLLAHLPGPPDTPRWEYLAKSTPTYWYRLMQPWVCLGILHHPAQAWEVLVDLALGVEDWTADAALFALVTAAYREPARRPEVYSLVRARFAAAFNAPRPVTIEESLAHLMLITPGCTPDDRAAALAVLSRDENPQPLTEKKRRWWPRRD
ncbi:hypothetical protein AB0M02_31375 [Actinoplanes sp. NPDC051861]|uniref:hypothetical protein n=1 Tax=Actinoplanes sp. NPDC051861 TaxID=3155170 RepID=UPI003438AA00